MSDDVSLGGEQNPLRSAEVLAPIPEPLLDNCMLIIKVNAQLMSPQLVQQCISEHLVFQPGVNTTAQACFNAALRAAYSLDILTHLNRLRPLCV